MSSKPDATLSHRFIRILMILLLYILVLIITTGCWDRKEINDLAFVMGAAIDQKSEGQMELSVQVFIPKAEGGGSASLGGTSSKGGTQAETMVISAEGVSIADAMSHLQERLPREVFWGHNEVYIFGQARAQQGIREDVDYMLRSPEPRERANVFISKGMGKDSLQLIPPLERNSSEVLREISKFHTGLQVTIKELAEMLTGDANAAALPYIVILPPEPDKQPNQTIAYIQGSAILKDGKMVGKLDSQAARGILWLKDELKTSVITVAPSHSKGSVSLRMIRSYTQLLPSIVNGVWHMDVHIETEEDVQQNTTGISLMEPEWVKTIEISVDKLIENRAKRALQPAQERFHSDIFGFADAFHRKHPQAWKTAKANWSDIFSKMEVRIVSRSHIVRPGISNPDATSPEKGVDSQ
ncbi:Ger(x)C family spore germination protein [Paenibacillus sp. WQ 127069]|uniref:Ger(X)C family spore germination protein n=1 Tax=Paenibacillus baimaensis TaxID=2982185 RepID=A0ABT2URB8_9BACL|nr:Ger(x)C family spore germination protein [Paenibacillus sp. WQ 127069]MCU6796377.1 Ger(x)C family spore germination protein [Paenibacillus sp. WQ 127069]